MKSFTNGSFGKVHVLRLDRGDYLLESIEQLTKEQNIMNGAVLSGIGTLDHCILHCVMTTGMPPVEKMLVWEDKPLEIASIDGIIANGQPHLHMVVSDDKAAYTGHVHHGCRILYLGEILIAEIEGFDFERVKNGEGINELRVRS
jgi:hypothetical protein